MKTIEEIRAALTHMHHYAMEETGRPYMSIPADPKRDADLILSAAIDELGQLRAAQSSFIATMQRMQSRLFKTAFDDGYRVRAYRDGRVTTEEYSHD